MAKAGNFPWRFPGSLCGEFRDFRLTENNALVRGEIWDAGQYKDHDSDIIEKYSDGRDARWRKVVN